MTTTTVDDVFTDTASCACGSYDVLLSTTKMPSYRHHFLLQKNYEVKFRQKKYVTRMWADAQRDGRPAEYRWRRLRKFHIIPLLVPRRKVWLTPTGRVPCSNAANVGECRTWTQSEVCTWQNSIMGQRLPKNVYIAYQPTRRSNIVQSFLGLR